MNSTPKALAALLLAASLPAAALNHEDVVDPIAPGRFEVACSNIEQDASRVVQLGGIPSDYWEGNYVDGRERYVTELLVHPASAVTFDAQVPDVRRLYPRFAGEPFPFVAVVCHPTSRSNTDPHYRLPETGDIVPHMQLPGTAPKLISAAEFAATLGQAPDPAATGPAPLPLVVYSHGLGGSPIGKGYINVMVQLAAQGYIVAAPFHGDRRVARIKIEDFSDFIFFLFNFDRIVEMQLMRPLALRFLLDRILGDPGYAAGIDASRIAGFGASLGGEAMVHLLGGLITTTLDGGCEATAQDARIKAAVGFVTYAGQDFLPAFCEGQEGAAAVSRPFMTLSGTSDSTAPAFMAAQAVHRMGGSRYFVELVGGEHEFRAEDAGDLFTWMVTFYNAYLQVPHDPGAMARLIRMRQVRGGREDNLLIDVHVPFANAAGETRALEFYNTHLDHFFMAAGADEIAAILAGAAGPGWHLTGESFKVHPQMPSDTFTGVGPVCRFYGVPAGGPNSHFFTASSEECEIVKRNGGWFYEGIGFYLRPVAGPERRCPAGYLSVNRAYTNGAARNDSNHRFTTSDSSIREMARRGWTVEGTVMCARP